jgi:hypothetical protein
MVDATAESIKSLEGYNIAWVEEAQTLSQRSLALLRPTIRADGSEIAGCMSGSKTLAVPMVSSVMRDGPRGKTGDVASRPLVCP